MMKKSCVAIMAGMVFIGVLAVGCEKKQDVQKPTEQKPAAEQAPKKKPPVGC
jgi:hypothetical protein